MPTTHAFRFRPVSVDGEWHFRPLVRVRLSGPAGHATVPMLIDTGADVSMIRLTVAEQLGLDLGEVGRAGGISESIPVYRAHAGAEILSGGEAIVTLDLPLLVPVERGRPPLDLLGRQGLFNECDIAFHLGPDPFLGTFSLTPVRDSASNRVPPRR